MAKIVFINPTQDFREIYGSLSEERSVLPPLGLCYLAARARSGGHDVKIIDAPALKIANEETARIAVEWGAGYAGITATTDSIFAAADVARAVKALSKDITTIIGGPHFSAAPVDTLERFEPFDIGVVGEGEETLTDLIDALEEKRDLNAVKGIAFRSGANRRLNRPRPFIQDLDSLPAPAWDLVPDLAAHYRPAVTNYRRLPSASLVTSRGCPGTCAFCDTRVFGSKYRIHSSRYVLEMIDGLKAGYGVRDICFYDDVFTVFRERLEDICDGLKRPGRGLTWSCQARVNTVNYETMKMMKEAGCWKISFGIESGSDEILKLMNKHATVEQARKAVREAKRAGLEVEGYFILGFFGETPNTLKMTEDFIRHAPLDTALLSYFLPFPGSPAYPHVREYGTFDEDWSKMNVFDRPQFIPKGLSRKDLLDAQARIYRNFYFKPAVFARYALKMFTNPRYASRLAKASVNLARLVFKN